MKTVNWIYIDGNSSQYSFAPYSYGDRSPRGIVARIFAIIWVLVWILVGLVITSIAGVVTTSLTAITLSTDVKFYGTKVNLNKLCLFLVLFSSSSLLVDRGAVDCNSSPTGSVLGSAHENLPGKKIAWRTDILRNRSIGHPCEQCSLIRLNILVFLNQSRLQSSPAISAKTSLRENSPRTNRARFQTSSAHSDNAN